MTSAFSWKNSVSLCPSSFCTPKPNLPVIPGISWLPTFAFQSPVMKRTSFWLLDLEGLIGLYVRPFNLSFFSITGQGIDLYWMVWKWTEIILSFLRLYPTIAFWTLLLTLRVIPFLLRDSCPIVVDIMLIWTKFAHSILVHWFLKCQCSLLPSPVCPLPICLHSWTLQSRFLCNIILCSIKLYFHH